MTTENRVRLPLDFPVLEGESVSAAMARLGISLDELGRRAFASYQSTWSPEEVDAWARMQDASANLAAVRRLAGRLDPREVRRLAADARCALALANYDHARHQLARLTGEPPAPAYVPTFPQSTTKETERGGTSHDHAQK